MPLECSVKTEKGSIKVLKIINKMFILNILHIIPRRIFHIYFLEV